jgi:hypothetical protein
MCHQSQETLILILTAGRTSDFFEIYVPTSQKTQCFSVLNTNKLILLKEISTPYFDKDMMPVIANCALQ